jgi:hypothetical protein
MSAFAFAPHQGFDPEAISILASVFEKLCAEFGLSSRADRLTELVARHVITAGRTGMRSETSIRAIVLQEFTANPQ